MKETSAGLPAGNVGIETAETAPGSLETQRVDTRDEAAREKERAQLKRHAP